MSARAATAVFGITLGAALLLRLACVVALPFGPVVVRGLEGLNDEPAHFAYVRHLVEHRSFPVQTRHVAEPGAFERADFEFYQPPLYYLTCAPLVAVAGEGAGILMCRAVSMLSGLLSLVVLAGILARLGLGPSARRAGVAFVALLPVHVYFTSLVSNDGPCWLFALLITRELLARVQGEASAAIDLRLGVLLGLGMLTKSAIAVFYPATLLVYALVARRGAGGHALRGALTALAVSALIAGAWYVRNSMVYGSPFALEVGFGPPEPGRWSRAAQVGSAVRTVSTLWFPFHDLPAHWAAQALRVLGGVLVVLHAGLALAYLTRRRPLDAAHLTIVAIVAVTLAGHLALGLRWGEGEGRFLLPALASIAYLVVAPVWVLASRIGWGERGAWTYLIALAVHPYLLLGLT